MNTARVPSFRVGYIGSGNPADCPTARASAYATDAVRRCRDEGKALFEGSGHSDTPLEVFTNLDGLLSGLAPHVWRVEWAPAATGDPTTPGTAVAAELRVLEETQWTLARALMFAADCSERVEDVYARDMGSDRLADAIAGWRRVGEHARAGLVAPDPDWAHEATTAAEQAARCAAWGVAAERHGLHPDPTTTPDFMAQIELAQFRADERTWQAGRLDQYLTLAVIPPLPPRGEAVASEADDLGRFFLDRRASEVAPTRPNSLAL